ncbi:MAG: nucleotidyltransferase domain-containing protein [Chloroflexota bacterium]
MTAVSLPSREDLQPIAKRFGLRLIVLFGSAARGRTHADSDMDIAVLAERPLTFNQRLKLWSALSPLFSRDVDLAVLNFAAPLLKFQVARDGKVLFQQNPFAWDNWKSYAFRQYWDTEKFRGDLSRYLSKAAEKMRHAAIR